MELLLQRLDVDETDAVLQTRVFKLLNTLAADVAVTLQAAIGAARGGGAEDARVSHPRPEGPAVVKSGLLNDVRITPDPRLNILIVAAPAESMDLWPP